MMSTRELFYPTELEPVWIIKPEKKDDKKKDEPPPKPAPPTPLEVCFGQFLPNFYPPYTAPPGEPKKPPKTVELKVSSCCHECSETLKENLKAFKGVKEVKWDVRKQKVTVEVTTANADEIVLESRKVYKKARLWNKDD